MKPPLSRIYGASRLLFVSLRGSTFFHLFQKIAQPSDRGWSMRQNRSMPASTVIPELVYPDVVAAADWLHVAFGFLLRLQIGDHRAQMAVGGGAVVLTKSALSDVQGGVAEAGRMHAVMVRVADLDSHYARARQNGVTILRPPESFPFGERQYTARDLGGHIWTFSETIADVAPDDWGGTAGPAA
jgi:uncharacterized glyoxalase superfamily protein PhnB